MTVGGGMLERALETLLAIMDDAVLIADRDGRLTQVNAAAEELLDPGRDLESRTLEADGRTPIEVGEQPLARALRGEVSDDVPLFVEHARGGGARLSVRARPLMDDDGQIVGALAVYRRERRPSVLDSRSPRPVSEDAADAVLVLVIDDEALVRRATTAILRRAGYAVLEAPNAEQALSQARVHAERIRVLVIDVVLETDSGLDLAERLRPLCPRAKFLFTSGYEQDDIDFAGGRFVHKPFSPADLLHELERLLG